MATRPPSFSTRSISRHTCGLSGERLSTQLETTMSTLESTTGRCSSSPETEIDRCKNQFLYTNPVS